MEDVGLPTRSADVGFSLDGLGHARAPYLQSPDVAVRIYRMDPNARARREQTCSREGGTKRIAWFHPPKTGSSFANTLYHYANASLPPAAQTPKCTHGSLLLKPELPRPISVCVPSSSSNCSRNCNCSRVVKERCFLGQDALTFLRHFPLDEWFRCVFWEKAHGNIGGHEPIDDDTYAAFAGRFFGFFRRPDHRATSAYAWYYRDFTVSGAKLPNATVYAHNARGTVAKMLTGQVSSGEDCHTGYGYRERCDPTTVPKMESALERLRAFAFIGLTEHWAASICLFHAKLGGPCRAVEFENSRPTNPHTTKMPWEASFREGVAADVAAVHDPWDSAVYAHAVRRFAADVQHHGLSPLKCASLCPAAPAGAFSNMDGLHEQLAAERHEGRL
jgi:hypothetical protein